MTKTQENSADMFIEIADIRDILVLLKDGSLRSLVEIGSVNFDLKSPDEQTAIVRGFQDFLNALDFPVQITVHSKKLDISVYLSYLKDAEAKITSELLKIQMTEYAKFVKELSELANIMDKKFFVTVPYYPVEAMKSAGRASIREKIKGLVSTVKTAPRIREEDLENWKNSIEQRLTLVIAALAPLGLKARILTQDELISLFREYYNPSGATPTA